MRPTSLRGIPLLWGLVVAGVVEGRQGVPRATPLPAPAVVLETGFTRITAVRELADGRVLVADAGERTLSIADFTRRSVTVIGREGDGPGEYRSIGQLFALAGDSTLMVDVTAGRWLLVHGADIVETVAGDAPPLREGFRAPSGADGRGYIIGSRLMGAANRPGLDLPPRLDSTYLVRVSRTTGQGDTIAELQARPARVQTTGPRGQPTGISITTNPLAAGDVPVMFPDGAVAIARVHPYRVDWVLPDGRTTHGAPLPFTRVPVTEREKQAVLRRQAERSGRAAAAPESVQDWPETVPPFVTGALIASRDGRLWVRRQPTEQAPETVYDVVDRSGTLVTRVTMRPNEHIAGTGVRAIYSVLTDDDGVQRLRRHPRPAGF